MTKPLSPAAQVVLDAIDCNDGESDLTVAAAAIRALVESTLPEEAEPTDPDLTLLGAGIRKGRWIERQCLRAKLLAVAAELNPLPDQIVG